MNKVRETAQAEKREKLVDIRNLKTFFFTFRGIVKAVDGVSMEVYPGETLGIVGESGCGKSVTSLSILRLIESPPGRIVEGEILFGGRDLTKITEAEMMDVRGSEISMIFQDPMTSLNPVYTVWNQLAEAILTHRAITKKEAWDLSIEMLKKVEIPEPVKRAKAYPHELSGGMIQRVMIAMALACEPKLLIADEPTTALDVTVQARILELMNHLKEEIDTSIMIVTHDMGVIAEVCDRVVVMYAGRVVEYTDVVTLFKRPRHPYTLGLMKSIPRLDRDLPRLETIPGIVPSPHALPPGCKFQSRCPFADALCREKEPDIRDIEPGHSVRCWHHDKLETMIG